REERLVLVLYYYEELTMSEIGAVLKLSESRVSQIHKDILQRLRQRFGSTLSEELVA
ncbi:MAG: sigma factor-like helix-turn-helix DNA-binding protein, partial [Phycisphaerae bacterium]